MQQKSKFEHTVGSKDVYLEVYYFSLMQVLSHGLVMSEQYINVQNRTDWHRTF